MYSQSVQLKYCVAVVFRLRLFISPAEGTGVRVGLFLFFRVFVL